MSAYIVSNETISVIAKAFVMYDVEYKADDYEKPIQVIINFKKLYEAIGQSLLNQNYHSVNYRYNETTQTPKYEFIDVDINEGVIYGCIADYEYQACETDDYFQSDIHISLIELQRKMLKQLIREKGYDMYD